MWRARSLVCAVISALTAASTADAAPGQPTAPPVLRPVVLVCHLKDPNSGRVVDLNFAISEISQTVDDKVASISNGAIILEEIINGKKYRTAINRYTGGIVVDTDQSLLYLGQCELAQERRF